MGIHETIPMKARERKKGTYSGHLSAPSAIWEFAARIVGNSDRRLLSVL